MKTRFGKLFGIVAAALLLVAPSPVAAGADSVAVNHDSGAVSFVPSLLDVGGILVVSGPEGQMLHQRFEAGAPLRVSLFDKAGGLLPDGLYTWEIRFDGPATASERGPAGAKNGVATRARMASGYWTLTGGSVLRGDVPEQIGVAAKGASPAANAAPRAGLKDQVILDDLIVDGSICAGFACVNGESFNGATLKLKETTVAIVLSDSSTPTYPTNDWQLRANDSLAGGVNRFAIDDLDGGQTPFTLEAGAREHALYVEDSGEVGLGTSAPAKLIHAVTGDTPTLRLEQDGSSSFTPQQWDVGGNEVNWFIRDVNNDNLPLRVREGAPENSLYVSETGTVGLGTSDPEAGLHIQRNDGNASLLVRESSSTAAARTIASFTNNGKVNVEFNATNATQNWVMEVDNRIVIDQENGGVNDGETEFTLDQDGDLTISGTFSPPSDRNRKENFAQVDPVEVLSRLVELPVQRWNYKHQADDEVHMGVVAQDFHAAFGLGDSDLHITTTDADGVTMAAIQGLYQLLEAKDATIRSLEERLAALEAKTP